MIITIANIPGLAHTSLAFKRKLWGVSQLAQTGVDNVATCIGFETGGTFSPSILNKAGSGACGLIQFMPSTAKSLGTSTAALATMTDVAQLDYVAKYLLWFGKGKLVTLEDCYMSILWPAGIGKPNDYVLFPRGTTAYKQNAGFDRNGDGVTKAEVCRSIRALYESANGRIDVEVDGVDAPELESPSADPTHAVWPDEVMARLATSLWDETGSLIDEERRDDLERRNREAGFGTEPHTRDDLKPIAAVGYGKSEREQVEQIMKRDTIPAPPDDDEPPPTKRT